MYGYAKDEIDAVAAEFQRFVKPSMFKSPIKLKVKIVNRRDGFPFNQGKSNRQCQTFILFPFRLGHIATI
ncbi:hypothetical protein O9G_005808 [Rozella allomycis CSF55]|uniref:Uncharacterized protein n=1 Tax=Rozella allomycis (strain CSF55) TaxID=988480 RepID=A0A075B0C0_ROZAC|nr:hypothetical protein O9G_005808 [Rozella allomycis CSF55]|eukprot:EPZ35825.1 hypothetical protein O9G_005808 [Rozella allomycis CSF55]